MMISQSVNIIMKVFEDSLEQILGEKLYGAYIFGSAAFPDGIPSRDIDFHVILKSELTDNERSKLEELHKALTKRYPPLGGEMDGYYILLRDALRETPPRSQIWKRATDDSWALHCEHIRAGRLIILYGPNPREIYPKPTWQMLEKPLCEAS
jgi:predicted nucleotidyltransferase